MKKIIWIFLLEISAITSFSQQPLRLKNNPAGTFQIGLRSDYSLFQHGQFNNQSLGTGGHVRLLLANQVNTEWFADYLRGDEGKDFTRTDYHIGWSVMFYPQKKLNRLQPYVFAGHCFDYSKIVADVNRNISGKRWSAAVQGGFGTHINFTPRSNLSLSAQYMLHLGNDIEAYNGEFSPVISVSSKASPESHLLLVLSYSYKIADLW